EIPQHDRGGPEQGRAEIASGVARLERSESEAIAERADHRTERSPRAPRLLARFLARRGGIMDQREQRSKRESREHGIGVDRLIGHLVKRRGARGRLAREQRAKQMDGPSTLLPLRIIERVEQEAAHGGAGQRKRNSLSVPVVHRNRSSKSAEPAPTVAPTVQSSQAVRRGPRSAQARLPRPSARNAGKSQTAAASSHPDGAGERSARNRCTQAARKAGAPTRTAPRSAASARAARIETASARSPRAYPRRARAPLRTRSERSQERAASAIASPTITTAIQNAPCCSAGSVWGAPGMSV